MTLPTIITPMNFTFVRDAICQLLADERDAQIKLAEEAGTSDEWIAQTIYFTVYPKRLRFPDVEAMPCVFVFFNEMDFPEDCQDIYENYAHGNLLIDYFAVGEAETGTNDKGEAIIIKTADENAEDRLSYLTSQIYKILCCESNLRKGAQELVTRVRLKKWKRTLEPEDENSTCCVLGASFSLELGFNEPTYYCNTNEIKEFYTSLKIRDEFIDPFVKIILDEE